MTRAIGPSICIGSCFTMRSCNTRSCLMINNNEMSNSPAANSNK